jgi:hypothetical protein
LRLYERKKVQKFQRSDIQPIVRAELKALDSSLRTPTNRTRDRLSKLHIQYLRERIDLILNPK